jgi:hypothetical protein
MHKLGIEEEFSMNASQSAPPKPPTQLKGFATYEDFLNYAKTRFALEPHEYEALFHVLLKLQGVGSDPIKTMQDCQSQLADGECLDMLKFMMYVDGLDLKDFNGAGKTNK